MWPRAPAAALSRLLPSLSSRMACHVYSPCPCQTKKEVTITKYEYCAACIATLEEFHK